MIPHLYSLPDVVVEAVVDRVEEDRLVLDLAPFPSLPIPHELAPELREGDRLVFELSASERTDSFLVTCARDGDRVVLTGIGRPFRWPVALTPRANPLWIRVRGDPDAKMEK